MKALRFPEDESVHDHSIEWWYFNGHLWDTNGNHYSLMHCLFRAKNKEVGLPLINKIPVSVIYFSHSILSDIANGATIPKVSYVSLVSKDSFKRPCLYVNHINYAMPMALNSSSNCILEETELFKYRLRTEFCDLALESTKTPLLVGGNGFINLHSKHSYYYSLTNIEASGALTIGDVTIDVRGKLWMDRQWANATYSNDKWTWFSVQLDGNVEILCCEYDDGVTITRFASMSQQNGHQLHSQKVILHPGKRQWRSPDTHSDYQLSWLIELPDFNAVISVEPLLEKQEVIFGTIRYWEGPLRIIATVQGIKRSGFGYLELLARPENISNLKLLKKYIAETAEKLWSAKNVPLGKLLDL